MQGGDILGAGKSSSSDSLRKRNLSEDSVHIFYRFFDSSHIRTIDSSIHDFNRIFLKPFTYNDLGNIGTPAQSLLFHPNTMKIGWDEGWHALDIFKYTLENTKYYTSSKPFSTLGYIIGSRGEQFIDILHTQNRNERLNASFDFRLLNAPGAFKNQNTNHSSIRANISSKSKNQRYGFNFIIMGNSLKAATNGGIIDSENIHNLGIAGPYSATTRIGNNYPTPNPFQASISAGNKENDFTIYYKHTYDFGQKDSLKINDSTYQPLFYPRLRLEHAIQYSTYSYEYVDASPSSESYLEHFQFIVPNTALQFIDQWKKLKNQFAVYTYPDKKNTAQYLKLFGTAESLGGIFGTNSKNYFHLNIGGAYRNTTKNKKWDLQASGQLYLTGNYAGNYLLNMQMKRYFGEQIGALSIGAINVNRTPSFLYSTGAKGVFTMNENDYNSTFIPHSNFPIITGENAFNNENITHIYGSLYIPKIKAKLLGNYYIMTNYTYFKDYFTAAQESNIFNFIRVGIEKETKISTYFKWYIEAYLQQKAGNVPINAPLLLMRNRVAFEGNFFKNLFLATGVELKYNTPYKPDIYSPFIGNFFYNEKETIHNLPTISYYLNFRIKRFRFFSEVSNLNSIRWNNGSVEFSNFNYTRPYYPEMGLWIRGGVFWNFIN